MCATLKLFWASTRAAETVQWAWSLGSLRSSAKEALERKIPMASVDREDVDSSYGFQGTTVETGMGRYGVLAAGEIQHLRQSLPFVKTFCSTPLLTGSAYLAMQE